MRKFYLFTLILSIAGAFVAVAAPVRHPILFLQLAFQDPPQSLPVPVDGVSASALIDTWGAPRGVGRSHRGIDIFAPKGTPVRSTTEGIVFRIGQTPRGGNVVWVMGPGRQMHYYAHLDRFGPIEEGDAVAAGDILGYVGNTGNARMTPPHLHYGLYSADGAVNPFPLLRVEKG